MIAQVNAAVYTSLNAVSAVGAGTSQASGGSVNGMPTLLRSFTAQKIVTGGSAITAVTVNIEGSLDGVNWFTIGTLSATTSEAASYADRPVAFVRANLTTLTATVNPSVTVIIAGIG